MVDNITKYLKLDSEKGFFYDAEWCLILILTPMLDNRGLKCNEYEFQVWLTFSLEKLNLR